MHEFTITRVEVLGPGLLQLAYADGLVQQVDVRQVIERHPSLWPLRDSSTFACAALGEWGGCVSWGTDALELAADNLRALGLEQAAS